jgi:chromosome segregation ATPase
VAQNQQQTQSGLDTLTATTTQVALDVITLDNNQTEQGKNLQANYQEVVSQLTAAAQGQQYMQGNLDIITATTTQVGLDVIALDDKQGKIGQTLQAGQQQFGPRLTQLAENQQQIDTALDTLTSTTTQVALDVIALDDNQAKQGKNLLATQQAFTAQIDTVTQGQQELQSNLDTVTATTSQVALDVITLDDNQGRIEQAVETNRQQLATRLTEIAQGQQQWLARFDAAEAKVDTMTASITAFEQRVTKLQGTLQTSLENLSTLLDTESQQRVQFQDSVRQDMQSVTDSISQLREIQAGLAGHIQRVQDSTQTQNSDILSALEQLQQKTDVDTTNVDTELKSSKAAPQEIMLP